MGLKLNIIDVVFLFLFVSSNIAKAQDIILFDVTNNGTIVTGVDITQVSPNKSMLFLHMNIISHTYQYHHEFY